jgi:peptidoglycan/LPS O-acetylase OafA/YrhL
VGAREPAPGHDAPTLVAGYRPWLDGLRGVAVLMVVAQHTLGAMPLDLGYVGVGLFFGLSGYLITSLLLDDRADRGQVCFSGFYLRRAARLVPALVLVLVVCDALFLIQDDPAPLMGSVVAVSYTANYAQVIAGQLVPGYGPTWSLAVEEHFYIVWPLVLAGIIGHRGLTAALRLSLAACLASLFWRIALAAMHAPLALLSVGSLERADALLYGCAAAIALRLGWRPSTWMLWLGLAVVAASPFLFRTESYAVLVLGSAVIGIASAAVVVGMDYAAPRWVRHSMSLRPVVVVGVLSYGIYLWHGPLMRIVENFAETGRAWRLLAAILAVPIAALSHRFLEKPLRARARRWSRGTGRSGAEPGASRTPRRWGRRRRGVPPVLADERVVGATGTTDQLAFPDPAAVVLGDRTRPGGRAGAP